MPEIDLPNKRQMIENQFDTSGRALYDKNVEQTKLRDSLPTLEDLDSDQILLPGLDEKRNKIAQQTKENSFVTSNVQDTERDKNDEIIKDERVRDSIYIESSYLKEMMLKSPDDYIPELPSDLLEEIHESNESKIIRNEGREYNLTVAKIIEETEPRIIEIEADYTLDVSEETITPEEEALFTKKGYLVGKLEDKREIALNKVSIPPYQV
jgi:hypothetical protein